MSTQTVDLKAAHTDAVRYFAAIRNKMITIQRTLNTVDPADTELVETMNRALSVLTRRYETARQAMHDANEAMLAARPACCIGTPVPHEPSPRCQSGRVAGYKHCTCDTCF